MWASGLARRTPGPPVWISPSTMEQLGPSSLERLSVQVHVMALDPRILVGALGLTLLVLGSRVYRIAVVTPGVLAGLWVAGQVTTGASSTVQYAAMIGLGLAGGILAFLLERFAVAVAGALIGGGLGDALGPLLLGDQMHWSVPAVAAIVGFLAVPYLYERLLPLLTAVLGALALAWAAGREQDLIFIALVAAAGLVLQLLLRRGERKD